MKSDDARNEIPEKARDDIEGGIEIGPAAPLSTGDSAAYRTEATVSDGYTERARTSPGVSAYLKLLRPYVLTVVLVFFLFVLIGNASLSYFPDLGKMISEGFNARFEPLLNLSPLYIMLIIFLNNAFISLLLLVSGLGLGVLTSLIIASNGYVIGIISRIVAEETGILYVLFALLPHGILELPMVFLSAGIGLRLGHQVLLSLIGKQSEIKKEFKQGIFFYFRWVVPLLFVAAFIETFITPLIMDLLPS